MIEIGDAYFYGAPPQLGRVIAIRGSSIEIEYPAKVWNDTKSQWVQGKGTMNCRSPEKGLCIEKT